MSDFVMTMTATFGLLELFQHIPTAQNTPYSNQADQLNQTTRFICDYYITSNWAKGRTTRFRFPEWQDFFFRLNRFYSPGSYPTDIEVLAFASGATSYYPAALLFLFHTMYVFPNKLTSAQARRLHVPLSSYPSLFSWAFLMAPCKAAVLIIFF